ncbi:hypothetical protein [Nocardia nova]|uniref:hypothetical protein n=1 Tax=Nocardia nova TaxID=37330 RepID=UPI000CEA5AC9|nr:hypothetical protein [Nocardia nova]
MSYQYSSLTGAIADKNCPLRLYLDQRFPNVKPIQADYRATAGTLLVDGSRMSPGTVGAAFDYILRFTLDPDYLPQTAIIAEPIFNRPDYIDVVREVSALAGQAHSRPLSQDAFDTVARASWALALCTELYRNPFVFPNSPLADPIRTGRFTVDVLLGLAPSAAVAELRALYLVAVTELTDVLSDPVSVALGPTFAASELCSADADIIVDGVLFELKTRLGAVNRKTGQRSDSLALTDLHQVIGYVLFDTHDMFQLHEVALYSARYGALHRWPLQRLLDDLAGQPVDLATERATVWELLAADNPRRRFVPGRTTA